LKDVKLCWALRRIFKAERPVCVLSFTIKPNVYGAFAASSLGIPAVANISGLGTVFIKRNWITAIVRMLYRGGLRAAWKVFFQNTDDRDYFVAERLVDSLKTAVLPGSGIDTKFYRPMSATPDGAVRFRFLLLGRVLWDKGIGEYVEAARIVRRAHPHCQFVLMGFLGVENTTAIPRARIDEWQREGILTYLPPTDDVRAEIARADCVVLPSYREGTPKSLLEAASMGKPVIATDVPGCRQVVDAGVTGFLARVRDAADLAEKMHRLIALPLEERAAMGARGRDKMVREFDEHFVIDAYLRTLDELTARPAADGYSKARR
jgi:glycosyltransferase involved in cell wall biosynthesis